MSSLRSVAVAIAEYLLGFLALAVFAGLAFGRGAPSDEEFVFAFKAAGSLAVLELAVLLWRAAPANRLIVGANLWLIAGAAAAFTEQWAWLRLYQRWGEASLFVAMLLVGVVSTVFSSKGFVGVNGGRRNVMLASSALLVAVVIALGLSVLHRGNIKWAAVMPVIALAWIHRLLKHAVQKTASTEKLV